MHRGAWVKSNKIQGSDSAVWAPVRRHCKDDKTAQALRLPAGVIAYFVCAQARPFGESRMAQLTAYQWV